MNITFLLEAQLRTVTGRSNIPLAVHTGATLRDSIVQLAAMLDDGPRSHLLQDPATIRKSLFIVVNGESIYPEEANNYPLTEGMEILLMPPIAGG